VVKASAVITTQSRLPIVDCMRGGFRGPHNL